MANAWIPSGSCSMLFEYIPLSLGIIVLYQTTLTIYRLYFSPLSHVPGPRIAAITPFYAIYHDILRGGQYLWVIEEMHKQYGPIVRIRPDTVHINDASFIDQIYGTAGTRRDKSQLHCNALMTPGAFVSTSHQDLHRSRRAPVAHLFSKQNVRRLEPIVQRCLVKVLGRLEEFRSLGLPLNTKILFSAATNDIITEYAFGNCWNSLDKDNLNEPFFTVVTDSSKMWHVSSYLPSLIFIPRILPMAVSMWLIPSMKIMLPLFLTLRQQIVDIKAGNSDYGSQSIMQTLLASKLPEPEKSTDRLFCESQVLLSAGTDTTASTLAKLTYHLLEKPEMLKRLKKELEMAIPEAAAIPLISQVENLPYLNALIKEVLRLHPAGSMRQERIAPDQDLLFTDPKTKKQYRIPKGTSMAMTAPLLSRNKDLYPSPNEFRPERYLEDPHLDRYSISWSRGSRICLGQNLAYTELHLLIAGIFRKYDVYDGTGKQKRPTLELFETTREDVDTYADFAVPFSKPGSMGIRVIVR